MGYRAGWNAVRCGTMPHGIVTGAAVQLMPIVRQALDEHEVVRTHLPAGSAHIAAGIGTGLFAATLSHPFDTIKTRMQAFIEPSHPRHEKYSSIPRAASSILRDDGVGAFFSGLGPRAFRISCARPSRTCGPCAGSTSGILRCMARSGVRLRRQACACGRGVDWTPLWWPACAAPSPGTERAPVQPNVLCRCAGAVFILSYCRSEIAPRYEVAKAELLSG